MNTRTDTELLRDFAESGSEAAFSEVVGRYVDFVYSAALRLVRDTHLAQDVSQNVFVALAQNARQLSGCAVLAGWLHRTARNLSANAVRQEVRRHAREQEAAAMNEPFSSEDANNWESVAPHLDAALGELNEADRHALLLRYFQRKSAREMATTLGISSEAAQKRVNRATERLRSLFAQRGIAVGASGLAILITANATQAAPAGAAAEISIAVFAAGSVCRTTAVTTLKIIAMTTFQKTVIATAVLAAIVLTIQETRKNTGTPIEDSPSHPGRVPHVAVAAANVKIAGNDTANTPYWRRAATQPKRARVAKATAAMPFPSTKMYALLQSKAPQVPLAKLKGFLEGHGRDSESLLAAFRTTGDPSLLAEALQNFPSNPQAAFEAAIQSDATPKQQRQWLDALKQAAPDNSLADYLSGLAYLKAGDTADAVHDLAAAAGKPAFQDYSQDRIQSDEEAYLAAGYPPGEAKLMANAFLAAPQLLQVKDVGQSLISLAAQYQQGGDPNSQANSLQMAANLGQRFDDPSTGATLSSQLIGISIERSALSAMDPNSPYGTTGQTVQQRLDDLAEQKEGIHVLTSQADPVWQTLSDQDWLAYHSQLAASGEGPALQWLVSNYGQ